jgi:hypothetical protein
MSQNFQGLSEEQQNECRAAMDRFVERHDLVKWGITIKFQDTIPDEQSVKIEITPPPDFGLIRSPMREIAVTAPSMDISPEITKMLELAYQDYFPEEKNQRNVS